MFSSSTLRLGAAGIVLALAAGGAVATAPSAQAAERTSITIAATKVVVQLGRTTTIRGYLKTRGADNEGKVVTLVARPAGAGEFVAIGTDITGPRGRLSTQVTPDTTMQYRWVFAGDDDLRASRSGVLKVRVKVPSDPPGAGDKLRTWLSIRADRRRVDRDGTTSIIGRLAFRRHTLPGKRILLLSKPHGVGAWSYEATDRTNSNGKAEFVVGPEVATRYRLVFPGTATFRATRSAVVRVAARPTDLSIAASDWRIELGETVTISGVLTKDDVPVAGHTVTLRAKSPARGDDFDSVAVATTGTDGSVTFPVSPTSDTLYRLVSARAAGTPAARSGVVGVLVTQDSPSS